MPELHTAEENGGSSGDKSTDKRDDLGDGEFSGPDDSPLREKLPPGEQ